uniref:Outer membrane protein beta-barrel domain-containing protein n=1 Tax=candidate division WOR-3 bacterium TaxID=2052148 RepID=A0A7C4GFY2_UNCW3
MRFCIAVMLCLAAASQSPATPAFRLGGRFIYDGFGHGDAFYDTSGTNLAYVMHDDAYWGGGCWLEYGPVSVFRFRLNVAELQFFTEGGGALATFPTTGLDITVEPPSRWRLVPYLLFGGAVTTYWGWQGDPGRLDPRFVLGPDYHVRFGLGARLRLSKRMEVTAEAHVLGVDTYWVVAPIPPYGLLGTRVAGAQLYQARLGASWRLGQ